MTNLNNNNWHKANRHISVSLVGMIQALFLFMIFRENLHSYPVCAMILVLGALLLTAHVRAPLHHQDHVYEHVLVAIWIPIGAITTYYLNYNLKLGPIIAAGIAGTVASFLPGLNKRSAYLKLVPPAIYCGAFIGMSSLRVADGFMFVLAASFFSGVLLVLSKSLFSGMGGKLGLIAFAGVVITSFCLFLLAGYGY